MAKQFEPPKKDYTIVPNCFLKNKSLNLKERGLCATLCSLPDGWDYSVAGFAKILPDGESAISTTVKSLEQKGLLIRKQKQKNGRFAHGEWDLYNTPPKGDTLNMLVENPYADSPASGSPMADTPTTENQAQLTNKEDITDMIKITKTTTASMDDVVASLNHYELDKKSIAKIIDVADEDIDKITQAISILEQQQKTVKNVAGFLISAIKNNYSVVQHKPEQKNSFGDYPQRDYNYKELENEVL